LKSTQLFDIVKVHYNKIREFNMYISNWTFRPAAGKQAEVIENSKKVAAFWEKYGANECHLFVLQGADVGCMSFIAIFDNAEAFGKANDGVVADPDFQELLAKVSSTGDFVRQNLVRRIF
jgi:hypothetical protein